jgi:hypothetical protein
VLNKYTGGTSVRVESTLYPGVMLGYIRFKSNENDERLAKWLIFPPANITITDLMVHALEEDVGDYSSAILRGMLIRVVASTDSLAQQNLLRDYVVSLGFEVVLG